ncbi:polymer-forming cytoskeletal protein, partial [Hyphomicrobium sp.]|uniref:bactofilin family protein n=1 Tax=Hyphomicrobium sp. TaxID=82 RepID=UPI0025C57A5D
MFSNRKADGASTSAGGAEVDTSSFGASFNVRGPHSTSVKTGGASAHSIVDEFLTMKGDLESEGDIHVKGKVFGNIRCKLLIIEIDALVEGGVQADEVIVRGNAKGTIEADRVRLEKTANVDSEICHLAFSAEEGARIKGSLRSKDEAPRKNGEVKDAARRTVALQAQEKLPA